MLPSSFTVNSGFDTGRFELLGRGRENSVLNREQGS